MPNKDNKSQVKDHRTLVKELEGYNKAYYDLDSSTISDIAYDKLYAKLVKLESETGLTSSVTSRVGKNTTDNFQKVRHNVAMLSLDNTYNIQEVSNWLAKIGLTSGVCVEDKIDGLALSLTYNKGKLVRAVTRGDGLVGDDVTNNAMAIENIPKKLPNSFTGEIRGEVCIYKSVFMALNKSLASKGIEPFANPRNLASGTLKTVGNLDLVKSRQLSFIAYYLVSEQLLKVRTHWEELMALCQVGFTIPRYKLVSNTGHLQKAIDTFEATKDEPEYGVDGAVIKVDDLETCESLGVGKKSPKWAIAYKYITTKATTVLLSIDFQVGRTGVITPVANLEPVLLCGTVIRRATLHNEDFINLLGLRYLDVVSIEKGGEIIPKVLGVVEHSKRGKPIVYPARCPICGSLLEKSDGSKWFCPDTYSTCNQFTEKLAHFASREALNIKGLGDETCKLLVKHGVSNTLGLYELSVSDIAELDGFKDASAFKLYKAIRASLDMPMEKWLFALGIPGVGQVNALNLCKEFKTWYKLCSATKADFMKVEGIGEVLACSLSKWFMDEENVKAIRALKVLGIPKRYTNTLNASSNALTGEKIAISGTFGQHSREFLAKQVELLGGEYHNSIKKGTTILLTGENIGKNKIADATKKNVRVLSTLESLKLLKL